ncbi:hypothetical protein Droror1_Dr00015219 [Drosera rotundifolia]
MAPSKHSKKKKKAAPNPQNPSLTDLTTLGRELLSSHSHINYLPILVKHVSVSSPPRHALESLISLQSFFTPLLVESSLSSRSRERESGSDGDGEGRERRERRRRRRRESTERRRRRQRKRKGEQRAFLCHRLDLERPSVLMRFGLHHGIRASSWALDCAAYMMGFNAYRLGFCNAALLLDELHWLEMVASLTWN